MGEDDDGTFGMMLRYDGGPNTLSFLGKVTTSLTSPWLTIERNSGQAIFGGQITGNGSGLTSVNADTLDSMDSSQFSTGSHTVDTNAGTICSGGQYLDGDGACKSALPSIFVFERVLTNAEGQYFFWTIPNCVNPSSGGRCICLLSGAFMVDDNDDDDFFGCQVRQVNADWWLEASKTATDTEVHGAELLCRALCMTWP